LQLANAAILAAAAVAVGHVKANGHYAGPFNPMAFADATPALNGLCWKIIAENLIETPPQNPLIE